MSRRPAWLREAERVDLAVYAAVAVTPTPALDAAMRRVSSAADRSRGWVAVAGLLSVAMGPAGRRAAATGLASVGVASAVVNGLVKPVARRRRPDRDVHAVPLVRHVRMPTSHSFPSGHAASGFAFASAVGRVLPAESIPIHALATVVAYSRVHTGVHFPGDVVLGAVIGTVVSQATTRALTRA
jgi:membrane-associated phospholipid phosphatase